MVKSLGYRKFAEIQVRRLNFDALGIDETGDEKEMEAKERR